MPNETPFRITLVVILVLTIVLMAYHRLQAAKSGERISHKEEGLFFAVSLRLTGLFMGLAILVYLIDPALMEGVTLALPNWLRFFGAIVGVLFFGLMYWTLTNLGRNLTDTVVTRTNATLVTTGPYRFVRHPFYVSTGLLICGVTLLTANCLIGLSGLVCLAMLVARTPKEEQKFIEKYSARLTRSSGKRRQVGMRGRLLGTS
jgi:protein-S-isoprenylcysteine O-methyltransferase Ste14